MDSLLKELACDLENPVASFLVTVLISNEAALAEDGLFEERLAYLEKGIFYTINFLSLFIALLCRVSV